MQNIDKPWHKKWWAIILFIIATIILILLVASGFYIANEVKKIKSGGGEIVFKKIISILKLKAKQIKLIAVYRLRIVL